MVPGVMKFLARSVLSWFGKVSHIPHPSEDMLTYPSMVVPFDRWFLLLRNATFQELPLVTSENLALVSVLW